RVRMEFAVVDREQLPDKLAKGIPGGDGAVYIAREDYEGLDLSGEASEVRVYRADREVEGRAMSLRPAKGLPRRVAIVAPADRQTLGVEPASEGLGVRPNDVPRLAQS